MIHRACTNNYRFYEVTQASIFAKNETEQNKNETNAIDFLDNNDNVVSVENKNKSIDCNDAAEQKTYLQEQNCNTTEGQVQIECVNISTTENDTRLQDCAHGNQAAIENNKEKNKNEIPNNDTILKYVYKKNDKVKPNKKSTGHEKNSLRRRKRSAISGIHNELLNPDQKAPLIVNYETSHGPGHGAALPIRNAKNNIKTSALADFNIETLHANSNRAHLRGNTGKVSPRGTYRPLQLGQHRSKQRNTTPSRDSEENSRENETSSKESGEYIQNKALYKNIHSPSDTNKENSDESLETSGDRKHINNHRYIDNARSVESKESNEQINSNEKTSRYSKSREQSGESNERDRSNENLKSTDKPQYSNEDYTSDGYKKKPRGSIESSNESSEEVTRREPNSRENSKNENNNSGVAIQDVDLDDFSYERIQVNEKGEVEPAKENHQNISSDPIILQTTTKPTGDLKKYNKEQAASIESGEFSSSVEKDESSEPININDGEVKPVVEINSDADNIELSEKNTAELSNNDVNKENESLETLLGVNIPENSESDEKSSKIVGGNPVKEDDVKQEFERIPPNYKHDEKQQNEENVSVKPETIENKNMNPRNEEGTLDVFTPKDDNFDEHLKLKFADVTVKLPEIKLPEDVLVYAREEPTYSYRPKNNNDNGKPTFYKYYNDDDNDETQKQKKDNRDDTDDEPAYYGYYDDGSKKQDYKKEDQSEEEDDEEENDEDLYEKFVRERFGKRGSFEKRSEQLQDINSKPQNPELYSTIKNILKKTEQVRKEAETSGDPKAGYMWTLEYGENA